MTITIHRDLIQGTQEWINARKGLLTASEMGKIVTPTLKKAANEKQRAHVYEIAAQRISGHVEPTWEGGNILRGREDEIDARDLYRQHYADVEEVGLITNDSWGFVVGYSPDGLVGEKGLIEAKSRNQRFQVETISLHAIPSEHVIQVQTGLAVSEREWCHFLSWSGGLPMAVLEAEPVSEYQEAIREAAEAFETEVRSVIEAYHANVAKYGYPPTERRLDGEILL